MSSEEWKCFIEAVGQFDEDEKRGATLIRSTQSSVSHKIFSIYCFDLTVLFLIDLIPDVREQREREAKRELKLTGQSFAKQRASGELSDRALADLALPATQGAASQHSDELDDAALNDAERALVGTNGARAEERGLVVECGGGVASEPASGAAASFTSPSAVDLTYDGASTTCNGASACSATKEQAECNTAGPSMERVPKVNIRSVPAERTIANPHSRPAYQRQFAIDEKAKAPSAAKRLPPLTGKPAAATTITSTGTSATQSKRARSRAQCD